MSVVYVAGSRSGAGATAIACGLAALHRADGRSVALVKPLSAPGDADPAFFGALGGSAATATINGAPSDAQLDDAARIVKEAASGADDVIVEGPPLNGGDGAPADDGALDGRDGAFADGGASVALARRIGAPVIAALPYERTLDGGVCATWRAAYGELLAGCVVNKRIRYAEHDACARLAPELTREGMPLFGVLPEERLLLAPAVGQAAAHLDGVYFAGADGADALIEHFLIGGLIMEWGGNYFGRLPNQAVLARGGRMDIQMSALNFPLNALFLTGCDAPAQYVQQRAEELDVPLIAVRRDTHEAAAALETLSASVTFHHPAKAERAGAMARESLDAAALAAAIGG